MSLIRLFGWVIGALLVWSLISAYAAWIVGFLFLAAIAFALVRFGLPLLKTRLGAKKQDRLSAPTREVGRKWRPRQQTSAVACGPDAARAWASDLLSRSDWVVLDTETTGLGHRDEVIQISIIAPDGTVLFDTLLMPEQRISAGARRVHGISRNMLRGAPRYVEVHHQLARLLQGKTAVCYNAEFDRRLLAQTAQRYGLAFPSLSWECAMQQYWAYLGTRARLPGGNHNAVGDCLATLNLIRQMAEP